MPHLQKQQCSACTGDPTLLKKKIQFKYAHGAGKINNLEGNVNTTPSPTARPFSAQSSASTIHNLALFHIQVYYFGKYLKYSFLITAALNRLQETLLSPTDNVGIKDFQELIEFVWKQEPYRTVDAMLSDQKDDWGHRRILATFGAVWDPAWRAKRRDLWEKPTAPDGEYQNYAFWHMAAKRVLEEARLDRELAPRVKDAMPKDFKMDEN